MSAPGSISRGGEGTESIVTMPPPSRSPPGSARLADVTADRELYAEAHVAASPARVWALLTDFARMPEWSPELVRMVPLKPGGLRVGQWYLGVNKRGPVVWPT